MTTPSAKQTGERKPLGICLICGQPYTSGFMFIPLCSKCASKPDEAPLKGIGSRPT